MTLQGRRIVITRAKHQSEEIRYLIEQTGGIPVMYPCIVIAPPANPEPLDLALANLSDYDWIIFSSSNTVRAIQNYLNSISLTIDWLRIKIAAVGTKTGEIILEKLGRSADFIPEIQTGNSLAAKIPIERGQKILLPQSTLADDSLDLLLSERGVEVYSVDAYTNVMSTVGEDVPALLKQNRIDAITFTSGSTVTNFVKRIAPLDAVDIPVICIGSSTCEVAIEAGFRQVYYPENYTIPDMIELLSQILR